MATIRDVAKAAGVSAATVSRVLRGDTTLSVQASTRQRVQEVAEKLGYRKPTKRVQEKAGPGKSSRHTYALLMAHSAVQEGLDPYFMAIREGIEGEAARLGLTAVGICRSLAHLSDTERARIAREAEGLIAIGAFDSAAVSRAFPEIKHVVFVDSMLEDNQGFDTVQMDLARATVNAMDYLRAAGSEQIVFLGGPRNVISADGARRCYRQEERAAAFEHHMRELGAFLQERMLTLTDWSLDEAYEAMRGLLAGGVRVDAVIAASDILALGAMRAIADAGRSVPDDIRVMGFNDMSGMAYLHPSLTSVHLYAREMGEAAARMLAGRLEGRRTIPACLLLPTKLIVRESTGTRDPKRERVLL